MSNDVSLDINQKSNPVQTVAPPEEDNNMLRATDKITALYCRLSVEDTKEKDGKDDPSNSIQHQKEMLSRYVREQGWTLYDYYCDDGVSGTTFDRPGLNRLVQDATDHKINLVLCKDYCAIIGLNQKDLETQGILA